MLDVSAWGASVGPDHPTNANQGLPQHLSTNYTTWVTSGVEKPDDTIDAGTVYLPMLRLGLAYLLAHEFAECRALPTSDPLHCDEAVGTTATVDKLGELEDDYLYAAT